MRSSIKTSIPSKNNKSLIKESTIPTKEGKIVFSFSNFLKESIVYNDFNNMYANKMDSINAVKDFFDSLKIISTLTISQLCNYSFKKQFHYNEFKEQDIIDRIDDILINGYNWPEQFVKNDLEAMYFEFQFSNGKRVIGTKVEDNVFSILFLDPNHLICKESSRDVKRKQDYSIPSIFEGWQSTYVDSINYNAKEFLQEFIYEYENDNDKEKFINNINALLETLKELC